jgi:hypothetical protein
METNIKNLKIVYIGEWSRRIMPKVTNSSIGLSYFVFVKSKREMSHWSWWTLSLNEILEANKGMITHEITEEEYYKLLALIDLDIKPLDAFTIVYKL